MSRKPTVVSLSKPDAPAKPKPKKEAPKASKAQAQAEPKREETESEIRRKPRAMKPPTVETAIDVFDPDHQEGSPIAPKASLPTAKRSRWTALLFATVFALITLGLGLWFTELIERLFARHEWLGWGASGLLAIALLCLMIIVFREIFALWRLRKLGRIREDVMRAAEDDSVSSMGVIRQIVGLYENRNEMQWHLSRLVSHKDDVMDDRDRLILTERYLMKPLDDEAKQIIASAAKRISVVTAVNPAPSLDVVFTGYQILRMLRQLTALYGNRPGSIGTLRLAGMVGSHLAVTGGLALSDTFIQQFLGKGLAGRLSAKLGEGTVNGIMTARIGIAALDLCRPMPFSDLERPGLKEFIATLAGSFGGSKEDEKDGA